MRRAREDTMSFLRCAHSSPVVVDELEGGKKKVARCLRCGQCGPAVREGTDEALRALRDQARWRGAQRLVPKPARAKCTRGGGAMWRGLGVV